MLQEEGDTELASKELGEDLGENVQSFLSLNDHL